MHRIQSFQYVSWLFITLMLSPAAFAGNKDENDIPWYQIEVIIFANKDRQGIMTETWPDPPEINSTKFIELTHPDDAKSIKGKKSKLPDFSAGASSVMPTPYELLKPNELQLIPVFKKLEKSSRYQPLLHIGWRQPTLHPDESTPVFVYQGVNTSILANPTNGKRAATTKNSKTGDSRFSSVAVGNFTVDSSQYGQLMSPSEIDTLTGPEFNPFYGTLRLSVSRYLHLEANLNYRITVIKEEVVPVSLEDSIVSSGFQQNVAFNEEGEVAATKMQSRETIQNLNLYETRRMRSKEIHYFDHPLMGIVVRVIPFEIPENEPNFDPASQAFTPGGKPEVQSPQ